MNLWRVLAWLALACGLIAWFLGWAFAYNVVLIPVAAGVLYPPFGLLLNPIFAAIVMAASSVTVTMNSMLLNRWKPGTAVSVTG